MEIEVYADWKGLKGPRRMGTLSAARTKGREVFSFTYDQGWIGSGTAQSLDPDLQFFSGPQYLAGNKINFGIFLDSSPDRWGRVLMDRREALQAKAESRKPNKLFEEDYLLGVYDEHRMGALRFKKEPAGPFLNDNAGLAAPPWTSLRELEFASLQLEKNELKDKDAIRWINVLLAPGASLGGARPKASVTGQDGALWIAKFPSVKDKTDIGGWEMVTVELAKLAGIEMAPAMVKKFNNDNHTFLSKRFDRNEVGERIHFASAMTLLGKTDGEHGSSYLDIAEFIVKNGAQIKKDLSQLWSRLVFNIAVKNTDDHLRNHGFILTGTGWVLSPAYDVNPVHFGTGLTLNIDETDNSLDVELARSVAKYFRVQDGEAKRVINKTKKAVEKWNATAKKYKISSRECDLMAAAFEP